MASPWSATMRRRSIRFERQRSKILGFPGAWPGAGSRRDRHPRRTTDRRKACSTPRTLIATVPAIPEVRGRPAGGTTFVTVADDQAQADYIVARVLEAREDGVLLRRQAVLFRSSHHSDTLELELTRRNIPYVKYGGLKFLEAAHVKDLLAVLRWADNPKNRIAAFRALQLLPGMGPSTAEQVMAHFERVVLARCFRSFAGPGVSRHGRCLPT
jgi:hypothetical protein